jgi:hypothetical protein
MTKTSWIVVRIIKNPSNFDQLEICTQAPSLFAAGLISGWRSLAPGTNKPHKPRSSGQDGATLSVVLRELDL